MIYYNGLLTRCDPSLRPCRSEREGAQNVPMCHTHIIRTQPAGKGNLSTHYIIIHIYRSLVINGSFHLSLARIYYLREGHESE